MQLMLITRDPAVATEAEAAGVDRLFVDLEILGKRERQGHRDTVISGHTIEDVRRIRAVLTRAKLLVRVNPVHENWRPEIDGAIDAGADILMLPMFTIARELQSFCDIVAGRARTCGLVETPEAAGAIDEIVRVRGIDELYIGLNDLHAGLGMDFIFEPLADGTVERLSATIRTSGLPFGFGGMARIGEGDLPAELILGEHVRLGSSCVILSRTFRRGDSAIDLAREVGRLREAEARMRRRSPAEAERDRLELCGTVAAIVERIRKRRP